jgi:hypothetical protein
VFAEPLKLSALSLGDTLLRWAPSKRKPFLQPAQDQQFRQEIARLEQDRLPGSSRLSSLFKTSRENMFLYDILQPRVGCTFADLWFKYPDFLGQVLSRSPEALSAAAAEWEYYTSLFAKAGISAENTPFYHEIGENLGIIGRTVLSRSLRQLKREIQRKLKGFWHRLFWHKSSDKCVM